MTSWQGQRIDTTSTHGTGCTLASAIALFLAQGATCPTPSPAPASSSASRSTKRRGWGRGPGRSARPPSASTSAPARGSTRSPSPALITNARSNSTRSSGLKQIVDNPPDYARFETAGGATFSVQIDPDEKILATTAVYFECDDLDERVEQLARAGIPFEHGPRNQPGCGARPACATPTATSSSSTRPANRAASRRGGWTNPHFSSSPREPGTQPDKRNWVPAFAGMTNKGPCRAAVPSSLSSIIRSRSPASTRPAARRSRARWSPPPSSSTAANSRAASTTARICRSKSARRSTPSWSNAPPGASASPRSRKSTVSTSIGRGCWP